ncbi:MAG: sulfatase-like hydrolase/transferase [Legionellales bacterium]|nr:sulfatase-like hydrolase/transferase [Legionellales bacterium]
MKNRNRSPLFRLLDSVSVFIFCILSALYIISDSFTDNGIDLSVIFHLKYGLEGAGTKATFYTILLLIAFLIFAILLSLLVFKILIPAKKNSNDKKRDFLHVFFFLPLILHPATRDLYYISYLQNTSPKNSLSFSSNYFLQKYGQILNKNSPNIIFIYLESLERTFLDSTIFPDLTPGLSKLAKEGIDFTNLSQHPASGCTIKGMVSSQCGILLSTPCDGNSMGAGMDRFLPKAYCIGDILKANGYSLSYIGGASLKFAGKGKFYLTHGFDYIKGLDELKSNLSNQNNLSSWGLYDETLFDLVFERVEFLAKQNQKFGVFTLTLDTHPPGKEVSKICKPYKDGKNPFLNAVHCTDYLVTKFVNKIKKSPYYKNTIIIIASDHLANNNSAMDYLKKGNRKNLLIVLNSNKMNLPQNTSIDKAGTTIDTSATLLGLMGYRYNKFGLGRNLLSNELSLLETLPEFEKTLFSWYYNDFSKFWDYPEGNSILIIPSQEIVEIDTGKFDIPALIQFKDDKIQNIRFSLKYIPECDRYFPKTLFQYSQEIGKDFIWVDKCSEIKKIHNNESLDDIEQGYCLFSPNMFGKENYMLKIPTRIHFDKTQAYNGKSVFKETRRLF